MPMPGEKTAAGQNGTMEAAPAQPAKTPEMPGAVLSTEKAEKGKEAEKTPPAGAAETAKVEELETQIAELKKTITQLQQAAVVKEDTAEKTGEEENGGEAAPETPKKVHHRSTSQSKRAVAARHATRHVAVAWILKAAKPGVAWVAQKGSSDLHMVETGDSLTGIGKVTAIVRDSSGNWEVNGTKGRISQ